jgi:excisionase family DNA binding protein
MSNPDKRWLGARERRLEPGRRSLTASEAAAIIGVSVATIRGWSDDGRLPSHRTAGGHRRFELEELMGWLEERGAPTPRGVLPAPARVEIPRCPELARELGGRMEAVIARVAAGYDPAVPTIVPPPSESDLRRAATRFVRVVGGALESGNPAAFAGRAEIAGFRGGLQGEGGGGVLTLHTRLSFALLGEAEAAIESGAVDEEYALPCLQAIIEHAQAAVERGLRSAQESAAS